MNYRDAITASIALIERACSRDDLHTKSRHELALLLLNVYDTLTEAVAPEWWERDTEAENEQKQRILDAM